MHAAPDVQTSLVPASPANLDVLTCKLTTMESTMEYVIVALIVAAVAFVAFRKRKSSDPFKGKSVVDGGAGDPDNRGRKDLF